MLKNSALLLTLICGLATGYIIGDYRGREARETLERTIATGQSIDNEVRIANAALKSELESVNGKHAREIERLRGEYGAQSREWQRTKTSLDSTIRFQNSRLASLNGALGDMIAQLGRTHGSEKAQLEHKIAILRSDIDQLLRELNGNSCLKTAVPGSVIETLNESSRPGREQ